MTHLNSTLGNGTSSTPFLTHDELINFPSVMAKRPSGNTSSRYSFIPTTRAIEQFEKSGFYPVKVSEARAIDDRMGFQKHIVRFRQPGIGAIGKDQIFPEIVLVNSHDAGAAFHLLAGLFRMICANGMIVGESLTGTIRINHVGYTDQAVYEAIQTIGDRLPVVLDRMNEFKNLEMTPEDRAVYAFNALRIKYGDEEVARRDFSIPALLEPERPSDRMDNLWTTFNTVQEKLVEVGGRLERRFLKRKSWDRLTRSYQPVTKMVHNKPARGPAENIRVNKALWNLTEGVEAELKAGGHWGPNDVSRKLADMREKLAAKG